MILLLLERLEGLRKKYSEKVGKQKDLQFTMKAQRRWTSGVSVSKFGVHYYRLLIIFIGQWVVNGMLFWYLYHPLAAVTLTPHISGLTVSRSRRLLVHGQHKSTSWIDIQSSDSRALPRSNTSGLRRYFLCCRNSSNYWSDWILKIGIVVPVSFRTCKGKGSWWQVSTCWRLVGREWLQYAIGWIPYSSILIWSALLRDEIWEEMWNVVSAWLFRYVGCFASANEGCRCVSILNLECCF